MNIQYTVYITHYIYHTVCTASICYNICVYCIQCTLCIFIQVAITMCWLIYVKYWFCGGEWHLIVTCTVYMCVYCTVLCTLYRVHVYITLYIDYCKHVYILHCTMYSVQCTVCASLLYFNVFTNPIFISMYNIICITLYNIWCILVIYIIYYSNVGFSFYL